MTWPAPTLKFDYSNTDPQQDEHPLAHNSTNQSLNDNYRPQISANLAEITAIRGVVQGSSPGPVTVLASGAEIRLSSAGAAQRRREDGSLLGNIAVRVGNTTFSATNTAPTDTTGPGYVSAVQVAPGVAAFTNGGYVTIRAICQVERENTDGTFYLQCGWDMGLGGGIEIPSASYRMGATVRTGLTYWVQNSWTAAVPPGGQPVLHAMVADGGNGGGIKLVQKSIMADLFRF